MGRKRRAHHDRAQMRGLKKISPKNPPLNGRATTRGADDGADLRPGWSARTLAGKRLRTSAGAARDGGACPDGVRGTSARDRRGWDGHGEDSRLFAAGHPERAAGCDFYGDKISARAAFPERYSISAKTFCAATSCRGDERPCQFSLPAKTSPDG